VVQTLIEFVLAPLLVAATGLAAERWGQRVGGVVSAFPAVVGPVLLITVLTHGPAFTARVADGTILGLVSLSGFAAAYARGAVRVGWVPSVPEPETGPRRSRPGLNA
jgi:Ca2+/H+ antiporter